MTKAKSQGFFSYSRGEMNSEEKPSARAKAAWESPGSVRAFLSLAPKTP